MKNRLCNDLHFTDAICAKNTTQSIFFMIQVYILSFYTFDYSECVLGSECCQNTGDLHSMPCLNASCVDTDGGLKLLLCGDIFPRYFLASTTVL